MGRPYTYLNMLRNGDSLDLGGITVKMVSGLLKPGDLYVAERNTGPQLGIVAMVHDSFIRAKDPMMYSYDIWECVKVEAVS